MIKFAVYDQAGPAKEIPLHHSYLVGKEDLTVPGSIAFENGMIVCRKHSSEAAALGVQIDAGPLGRLCVQTCLLPDREEPYNLYVELARHRIMLLLNKLEEWALSDLPDTHEVITGFEKARELFTGAIATPHDGKVDTAVRVSQLARQSLALGIEAGERMTLLQAERDLAHRTAPPSKKSLSQRHAESTIALSDDTECDEPARAPIGCTLYPDQFSEPLQKIVARSFDFVSVPARWSDIEREEGQRNFVATDRWIEWAVRTAKLPVCGGPLLDLSARALPRWLMIWENDYKTLRELAYEHLKAVVTRYRRAVPRWTVISGVNANMELNFRLEEMVDLTRLAVLTTKKLQPAATVLVEISSPFGEQATHIDRSLAPILYAGLVKESGINFDGFAVRLQMGDGEPGRAARDLMQLSAVLDVLAEFDKPIHITAVGAPSVAFKPPSSQTKHRSLYADPGYWHAPWSPRVQAEWLTSAVTVAASKPCVQSVCWQMLWDSENAPEMRGGGVIASDGKPKPALKRLADTCAALRAGASPLKLPPVEAEA
ncbi:MAG: hypothetical protein SFZ24_01550 [Planctomycetota bacterium]|nr:hypothetical protein [Planctomycetota bacterium]